MQQGLYNYMELVFQKDLNIGCFHNHLVGQRNKKNNLHLKGSDQFQQRSTYLLQEQTKLLIARLNLYRQFK